MAIFNVPRGCWHPISALFARATKCPTFLLLSFCRSRRRSRLAGSRSLASLPPAAAAQRSTHPRSWPIRRWRASPALPRVSPSACAWKRGRLWARSFCVRILVVIVVVVVWKGGRGVDCRDICGDDDALHCSRGFGGPSSVLPHCSSRVHTRTPTLIIASS